MTSSSPTHTCHLLLLFFLAFLTLPHLCFSLVARIDRNDEKCYYELASKGEKIVGNFHVLEGGAKDIDVRITDPMDKVVFELQQKESDSFQFFAMYSGQHTICFSNRFSMVTGKTVKFNLYVGSTLARKDAAKSEHFTPLEQAVVKLKEGITAIDDTTDYLKARERVHHLTVQSTNFRIVVWRCIQIAALVVMAIAKIMFLRNLFEQKRGV